MGTANTIQSYFERRSTGQLLYRKEESSSTGSKEPSVMGWYQILRAHYHWPLFQAIRYALWLAR